MWAASVALSILQLAGLGSVRIDRFLTIRKVQPRLNRDAST